MRYFATIAGALVALCASSTAIAAVTVIGTSPARQCYQAALDKERGVDMLPTCDFALSGALTNYEVVATHVNRGILRMYRGNLPAAIADYDAAISRDPDQAEAWLNKGVALIHAGAPPAESVRMFDAAIRKGTREPALAHYARALAQEEAGNVRAAYADLVKARTLSPKWSAPARELRRYQVRQRGGGTGASGR